MTSLQDIPHHIFQYMQDCLQTKLHDYVYYQFGKKNNYYDDRYWRNFMNTSKSLHEVKKATIYLKLNTKYSVKFLNDLMFHEEVLSRVRHARNQIGLDLVAHKIADRDLLVGINGVNCVDLSFSDIEQVDMLGDVQYLLLSECSKLLAEPSSSLNNVQNLDLSYCGIESAFLSKINPRLQYLDLSYCNNIRDVSMLTGIRTLKLRGCKNISDVSMLGNAYELDLAGCERVRNVSQLGRVTILSIAKCDVTDISALSNVRKLDVSDLNLPSLAVLTGVKSLRACRLTQLRDLQGLEEVEELDITGCSLITDLSNLRKVKSLTLAGRAGYFSQAQAPAIKDIGYLTTLKVLHLRGVKVSGLGELINLEELWLDRSAMESIKDEKKLFAKRVHLQEVHEGSNLACLEDVKEMKISNSYHYKPRDLKPLKNLRSLTMTSVRQIGKFEEMRSLTDLHLYDCQDLTDLTLTGLSNVTDLFVRNCPELKTIELNCRRLHTATITKCDNVKTIIISQPAVQVRIIDCNSRVKIEVTAAVQELILVTADHSFKLIDKKKKIANLVVSTDNEDEEGK